MLHIVKTGRAGPHPQWGGPPFIYARTVLEHIRCNNT